MKKILIISYYFPPSAKAGAHRAYSMAEYLPQYGWEPIFIAPKKGYFGRIQRYDDELLHLIDNFKVYRIPFFYPYNNDSKKLVAKGVRKIWEKFLFPDGKVLWNRNIRKSISAIIEKQKPDIIFITGTPFSTFLLCPYLKEKFAIPVVLDYRDPWSGNIYQTGVNSLFSKIHYLQEKKAIEKVDLITTASYAIIDYIKEHSSDFISEKSFFAFPYGYSSKQFNELKNLKYTYPAKDKITATFAGFVHGDIEVDEIVQGISKISGKVKDKLIINCYGTLFGYSGDIDGILRKYNLNRIIKVNPFLSYKAFVEKLIESDFLILPHGESELSRVLYPTKLFDYLGAQKPILYLGADSQVSETILTINAGICCRSNSNSIKSAFEQIFGSVYNEWYSNTEYYKKFERQNIFKEFSEKLNNISVMSG